MRNRYYSRQPRKPVRQARKGRFFMDSSHLERAQKADCVANSVVKAILWFGYGFALVSWFVAVNGVILFSQMMKVK